MRRPSGFAVALGLVALAALMLRTVYAVAVDDHPVIGDALTMHGVAQQLADGHGFVNPFTGEPTAEHPPLWELVLAGLDKAGITGYLSHRIAGGALGTVTVVLVGLLGRTLAGPAAGLAAATVAAGYPMLFTADASLMSETLYGVLVAGTLLASMRALVAPAPATLAALGALIGLAALTRGEGLALAGLLPLVAWGRPRAVAAGAAAMVLVIAPWAIHNARRFDATVLISTNANAVFVGANCADTYFGPLIGSWRFQCYTPRRLGEDEAQWTARQRGIGLRYASDHADRIPVVLAARLGRLAEVFRPEQSVFLSTVEGRPARPVRIGIRVFWALALLAVGGTLTLRRRLQSRGLLVVLYPVAMAVAVALASYGSTRFRFAAEPSICVLAGAALGAAWARFRPAAEGGPPAPAASRPA